MTFKVPPMLRTLAVTATPQAPALEPGGQTTLDVVVLDAAGKGVKGAEVAVWVVDESVLALTGYKTPDPLTLFYASRGTGDGHAEGRPAGPTALQEDEEIFADGALPNAEAEGIPAHAERPPSVGTGLGDVHDRVALGGGE